MERDPRKDPKKGDVLTLKGISREVLGVLPCGNYWEVEYYRPKFQRIGKCWRTTWLEWARHAEVIHVAD